ncbi:MAG: hypothetical protein WCL21_14180 [Mariniphaga sp.]
MSKNYANGNDGKESWILLLVGYSCEKSETTSPMKRAMRDNFTQTHDYPLASSIWQLKNKL